jgi:hypothetical protein
MIQHATLSILCAEPEVPCICSRTKGYYLFRLVRRIGLCEESIYEAIEGDSAGIGSCRDKR